MDLTLVTANLGHAMHMSAAPIPQLHEWLFELQTEGVEIGFLQEMPTAPDWDAHLNAWLGRSPGTDHTPIYCTFS